MYKPRLLDTSHIELPEIEKEYDRSVAIKTVKVILALGFEVDLGE